MSRVAGSGIDNREAGNGHEAGSDAAASTAATAIAATGMSGVWLRALMALVRREFSAYFATPIAWVFLAAFAALAAVFTFRVGNFMGRGVADLAPFFMYLPWLLAVLTPAVSMRLWAEERASGSIELLMTLPISTWQAVLAKWLAGWLFLGLALLSTTGLWLSVNWLGTPDNGVIALGYVAAWMSAGVLLAAGATASALTRNQVIAFVLGALLAFLLLSAGTPLVRGVLSAWLPAAVAESLLAISLTTHFAPAAQGVISLADVLYWLSMTAFWLFLNVLVVEWKKAA